MFRPRSVFLFNAEHDAACPGYAKSRSGKGRIWRCVRRTGDGRGNVRKRKGTAAGAAVPFARKPRRAPLDAGHRGGEGLAAGGDVTRPPRRV